MKICKICGVEKPLNYFHKNKTYKDGHDSRCKECSSKIKKEYYINNKEYINARNRKNYLNNRNKTLKWHQINNKTIHRKEQLSKYYNKRKRRYGFNLINKWFLNSEGHHINEEDVLYIPTELHRSIWHRQDDSILMYKINKIAFEWYWKELIMSDIQWL